MALRRRAVLAVDGYKPLCAAPGAASCPVLPRRPSSARCVRPRVHGPTPTRRAALDSVDRTDRELFVRRYYYGQTVARAAEEMGLNLSTAKSRLRRGREKLKELLGKAGYEFEAD